METNKLATAILAGLTSRETASAQAVTGGMHDANSCGASSGCLIWPGTP